MHKTLPLALLFLVSLGAGRTAPAHATAQLPAGFTDVVVADSLRFPVGMAFLPDGRLLVTEAKTARLLVFANGVMGQVGAPDSVDTAHEEEGLLGVAVDPGWPGRPYVYLFHDALEQKVWIARYRVNGDLANPTSTNLTMDPVSRHLILRDIPDLYGNHNGGTLRFGLDGMLYAGLADDAFLCTAQDTVTLRGVILRMDVSGLPDGPGLADKASMAPPDNPFHAHPDPNARLVWAIGLRNPFRFHIDPLDGAIYVGDVGHIQMEEIDVCDAPGMNFGWPFYEGSAPMALTQCGTPLPGLTYPIFEYEHLPGLTAVVAGPVYRSPGGPCAFPAEYEGDFFFADHYEGVLRRLKKTSGVWSFADSVDGQPSAKDWARSIGRAADFAVGPDGALWFLHYGNNFLDATGEIHRLCHAAVTGVVTRPAEPGIVFAAPWPSPARGSVNLAYTLSRETQVTLSIIDATGRLVWRRVASAPEPVGRHVVAWDGTTFSGTRAAVGIYVARLVAEGTSLERRFPLLR